MYRDLLVDGVMKNGIEKIWVIGIRVDIRIGK